MDASSELDWLMQWYSGQCDGDWEHTYGVRIDTLDNPGWSLKIDLKGTRHQDRSLEKRTHNYEHEQDWWVCWAQDGEFHAAGGSRQLNNMIRSFRNWTEETS